MSFINKAKAALDDAVHKHGDKISHGIDKAASTIDHKTGGKHADKVAKGAQKAKETLDKRGGKHDGPR